MNIPSVVASHIFSCRSILISRTKLSCNPEFETLKFTHSSPLNENNPPPTVPIHNTESPSDFKARILSLNNGELLALNTSHVLLENSARPASVPTHKSFPCFSRHLTVLNGIPEFCELNVVKT